MKRPTVSDAVAKDVERVVDEFSAVDTDRIGFEQQVRILLALLPEIDQRQLVEMTTRDETPIHQKYS